MANWFSDHFGADGSADSSIATLPVVLSAGLIHGRLRIKRSSITVLDSAAADVLRMMTMRSSDRLYMLFVNTDGGFSASNSAEVGLYTYSAAHTGAVLDVDLFGAALDLTAAVDIITGDSLCEIFTEGAAGGEDRGKQLWEIYALGAGTDSVDPGEQYDLCVTLDQNDDATSSTLVLWAIYTAGD